MITSGPFEIQSIAEEAMAATEFTSYALGRDS